MHAVAIQHLRQGDARLGSWIDRLGPVKLPPRKTRDPYLALLRSVVHQQLNGTAAKTIWGRVLDLFEDQNPAPERLLAITDERLRSAGLSRNKASAMRAIAAGSLNGDVPDEQRIRRMTDSEIYEQLTKIRGIGPWTVEMLLIFSLRRPDVMPLNDFGVRKAFTIVYKKREMPTPRQLLDASQPWRPYRTTAALYLWRIADAQK